MNKINVVIVDDESDSIGVLKILLHDYCPQVDVIASFTDSTEALAFLSKNDLDILFMDIEMPRLNGFEMLARLGRFSFKPVVISAYDQFGIKAVKHNIFDYLVKPIDPDDLINMISRYQDEFHDVVHSSIVQLEDKILLPHGNALEFIQLDEIVRCESDNNYTHFVLSQKKSILLSKTLKAVEETLPTSKFIRVHNKHLINLHHIRKYIKSDGGFFLMSDEKEVPLSRYRKDEVLKFLGIK